MSVIVPWRKKDSSPNVPSSSASSNLKHRKTRWFWVVLIPLFTVCLYLCSKFVTAYVLQKAVVCSWENAALVSYMGDKYVVETPFGFEVCSGKGVLYGVQKGAGEKAMLTTHGLVISDSSYLWLTQGDSRAELAALQPGTRLLRSHKPDEVVMATPSEEGSFGEVWIVSTAGLEGYQSQWAVPSAPIMAYHEGRQMFVATVDIETGGEVALYCYVRGDASEKWSRRLGSGMWRNLLVNKNSIAAVLDTGVKSYSFSGDVLWSLDVPGKVMSADLLGDTVVLSWAAFGEDLQDLSSYSGILAVSQNGDVLWRRYIQGNSLKVIAHENSFSGAESDQIISVLSETSVTWMWARDGRDISVLKTSGMPVHAGKDFVLVKKGSKVQLIARNPFGE